MLRDEAGNALLLRSEVRRVVQAVLDVHPGQIFQLAAQVLQDFCAVDRTTPSLVISVYGSGPCPRPAPPFPPADRRTPFSCHSQFNMTNATGQDGIIHEKKNRKLGNFTEKRNVLIKY